VHPDIPYTSHNSSNCVGVELPDEDPDPLFHWACGFVAERSAQGADPGVCLARADALGCHAQVPAWACGVDGTLNPPYGGLKRGTPVPPVVEFGQRAQREVLKMAEAERVAQTVGCRLAGLAGTRGGMIGALAAVGLRAGGNDGRFTTLGRVRDLPGRARVQDILNAGVERVQCNGPAVPRLACPAVPSPGCTVGRADRGTPPMPAAGQPRAEDWVETYGWARPRLVGGQAVLWVERSNGDAVDWIVTDRRRHGQDRAEH